MSSPAIDHKIRLQQYCIAVIKDRIASIALSMANAQAAANSEEKSSAGDKYETSRAMSHLEKDMQGRQLAANQNELAALLAISCQAEHVTISPGSVVTTDSAVFFIAAGLGKIAFEGRDIYLISPNAPVARSLLGKVAGDTIIFNNKTIIIKAIS